MAATPLHTHHNKQHPSEADSQAVLTTASICPNSGFNFMDWGVWLGGQNSNLNLSGPLIHLEIKILIPALIETAILRI